MRLGADGYLRATTLEEHMAPDIYWLPDPEFDEAFDKLMEKQVMIDEEIPDDSAQRAAPPEHITKEQAFAPPQAAFTEPTPAAGLPAFINARAKDKDDERFGDIRVSVRSRGEERISTIHMTDGEFRQFLADAARLVQ